MEVQQIRSGGKRTTQTLLLFQINIYISMGTEGGATVNPHFCMHSKIESHLRKRSVFSLHAALSYLFKIMNAMHISDSCKEINTQKKIQF